MSLETKQSVCNNIEIDNVENKLAHIVIGFESECKKIEDETGYRPNLQHRAPVLG